MDNMKDKNKAFQGGGVMDEEDLYRDETPLAANAGLPPANGLEGELANNVDDNLAANQGGLDDNFHDNGEGLTGVEQFLTNYGVQGGIIVYEDGSSARFSELDSVEQSEILSSLVAEATPTLEAKYDLDEDEVNLLNTLRESEMSAEEFINNMVNYRVQVLSAQMELDSTDYDAISDDGIFVKNLRDTDPNISDEAIAEELVKAQSLPSYEAITETMRKQFINEQAINNSIRTADEQNMFIQELEAQRHEIVQTVEDIREIGGAVISQDMKEYLLHDIMELNDNNDPIIMEKLFSDPEALFKANWFLNYGEAYMKEVENHWKREVSKARKDGYIQATSGMPGQPTTIPGVGKQQAQQTSAPGTSGRALTEEELFEQQ
jgi:hypothetical protein